MKPSFRFIQPGIMALVAAAGILLALSPVSSDAQSNTAYGVGALQSGTTTGLDDSAFGVNALHDNTTGAYNTATGVSALLDTTTGASNTATGANALTINTTGAYNTADGQGALHSNTVGMANTANGYQALHLNTTGTANTANGYQALYNCTTDNQETATGYQALYNDTTGTKGIPSGNVADGYLALYQNTTGYSNVADGYQALFANSIGVDNVAIGYQALYNNTYQGSNTAIGCYALENNVEGYYNVAEGYETLVSDTSGYENVANGVLALGDNTSGYENVAEGFHALFNNTSGSQNTVIGHLAGLNLDTGSNNIVIGDYNDTQGGDDVSGESNSIRIGEVATQTATYIAGISGTSVSGNAVYINSSGQLGLKASSRQFKQNIKTMGDASDVLLSLRPVTFQYKPGMDPKGSPQFGLIAEEVEKACPDLVVDGRDGKPYSVRYDDVNVMLLNEFLKEHKRVEEQGKQLASQEQINAEQAQTIAQLRNDFQATVAEQQQEIRSLTASLKQQASLLQKVSAQMEVNRPAPRIAANNN